MGPEVPLLTKDGSIAMAAPNPLGEQESAVLQWTRKKFHVLDFDFARFFLHQ